MRCRSTENSYMKTKMVHTLHRIKATASQSIESFMDVLNNDEYQKCLNNTKRRKTQYVMTIKVFVNFLFWVRV
jgi:hypothetical protein